jgi:molecular chaperone GrpE (heat shock protein)
LIQTFQEELKGEARHFKDLIKDHRQQMDAIVRLAEETCRASSAETHRTVETFKVSLNEMLGKIGKFMERVVQDTTETHKQALETKEYAKQISELIHLKEAEIAKLREGFHLHLITPLTKAFLKIRDDLRLYSSHAADSQTREQLTDFDQKIGSALADLQIEEIQVREGEKPHENLHARYWESLGAPEPTADPSLHGTIARIQERGYQHCTTHGGEPHVIRKAILVIYSCTATNGKTGNSPTSEEQINTPADSPKPTNS